LKIVRRDGRPLLHVPRASGFGWGQRTTAALAVLLSACAAHEAAAPVARSGSAVRLLPVRGAECRAILQDDAPAESLRQATLRSLDYLARQPAERELPALDRRVRAADLVTMLNALIAAGDRPEAWRELVCDRFQLYRAADGEAPAGLLVTGYYQPELPARRARSERFRYPLYRTPSDLVDVELGRFCPSCAGRVAEGRVSDGRLVPYYTRAEIDAGALAGRDYEIAWLEDPVEAFFLHVQGSARLRFDDGVVMDVSYSSSNGRPYTNVGRVLVEEGKLARETLSLQTIKEYLGNHPDEQGRIMAANERYIFFRTVPVGPVGSAGVPLTPGRSLAADMGVYPPGGLAFVRIAAGPTPASPAAHAVQRFALIQDTGVAITGPRRIDVYWGTGTEAESIAGGMRNPGEMYVILPS
jgi:membrane-bound lytic murein transglycosylase A